MTAWLGMRKSPKLKAQDEHQDAEKKLSSLMDSMPDFVCFKDGEGRWIEVNAFALKVFQLEEVDCKGKKNTELVSPGHLFHDALKECDISDEAAWQDGIWRGEEIIPRPDGQAFVFDVIKVSSFNPGGSRKVLTIVGRDITERKRVEKALMETKAILQATLDNTQAGIAIADAPDGKLRYVNKAGLLIRGKNEEDAVRGVDINKYVSSWQLLDLDGTPLQPDQVPLARAVLYGETGSREFMIRRPDNEDRIVCANAAPILDSEGRVKAGIVVFHDITESKQAEEKLRASEQLFRTLFNAITDSLFVNGISKDGWPEIFWEVNEVACQQLGYSREELLRMSPRDIDATEARIKAGSHVMRKLQAGENVIFEQVHIAKNGRHIPVEIHARPFSFHGRASIIALVRDITERKKAASALEQSEKKARHLNELLRAMYDIQHLIRNEPDEGKLLDGVCNILVETRGYVATWIGVPQPDSKRVIPVAHAGRARRILQKTPVTWDDTPNGQGPCGIAIRERILCIFGDIATDPRFEPWRQAALAAGCGSIASFPMIHKKRLWGAITIKANRPDAFSEEEIELLQELANEVAQALQGIEHRTERERMEEMVRQEQKMVAIGQLAGGVAHDFNNILGANMLQISLMMERPDLTPEMRSALEELEQGAFRASNLTRQLLMFSRKQAVQMKALDLKGVMDSVHGMLSRILGEAVLIKLQTDVEPMWVRADHGMIEQVIVNLCVNARDAMPQGGTLTLRLEKLEIEAGSEPVHLGIHPGRFVCLSVADTGTGIASEDINHIFEPFYTTKEVGRGTGLGLATVYGIVQQHGGWIDMESQVGTGTLFRVYFPCFDNTGKETAFSTQGSQAPKGRETLLVVEDDVVLLRAVISGLQLLGYRVVQAVNGVNALQKWEEHSEEIDLLLTDMVMPGEINGLELAHQIQSKRPGFKVIISSGYSNELNNLSQESCPGITLLPKPYGIAALAKTIRQCLDAREAPR